MTELKTKRLSRGVYVAMALFLVLLGLSLTASVSYTIKVTEAQAQTLLDTQLAKLRAKEPAYEIDHVTIHFVGDHMTVEAAGEYKKQFGEFPELDVTAALSSTGAPDYRSGGIYFLASEFSLDTFLLNGEEPSDLAKRLVGVLATDKLPKLRDKLLARPSVGKLLDKLGVSVDTAKNDTAIADEVVVINTLLEQYREPVKLFLEDRVRNVLETTPLYTLGKNWKEQLALALLSDISIKAGVLTATLTGLRLLWTLLIGVLGVAFIGALVMLGISVYRHHDTRMPS